MDTSTTQAGAYKQIYGKKLSDALGNRSTFLWDKIGTAPEKPVGEGFFFFVDVAVNQAGGPTTELAPLREAQADITKKAQVTPVEYEGAVEFSNKARRLAKNGGSATSLEDHSFTNKLISFRNWLANDVYRDGTGTLSLVNGTVTASATVIVDDATPFPEQLEVDFYDAAGTTFVGTSQVKAQDLIADTLTMNDPLTLADNAVIRRKGVSTTMSIHGLKRIVDTTTVSATYLGLSRTDLIKWRGQVMDNAGNPLSADLLQQAMDRRDILCGEDTPEPTIVTHPVQRRKYLTLATPQRRFMNGTFDLGHDMIEFNGKGWFIDTKAQRDTWWLLVLSDIEKFELNPLDLNDDGGATLKWVPGYRKVLGFYEWGGQVAARHPYWHLQIKNLATLSL